MNDGPFTPSRARGHDYGNAATDLLLAAVAARAAGRLAAVAGQSLSASRPGADSRTTARWWAFSARTTALAAGVGAAAHAADPVQSRRLRDALWRSSLAGGGVAAGSLAAGGVRLWSDAPRHADSAAFGAFAALTVAIATTGRFAGLTLTTAAALALTAGGALAAGASRRGTTGWTLLGVGLAAAGGLVQAGGFRRRRPGNHNDIFHLLYAAAIPAFVRAATDRPA